MERNADFWKQTRNMVSKVCTLYQISPVKVVVKGKFRFIVCIHSLIAPQGICRSIFTSITLRPNQHLHNISTQHCCV